VFYLVTGYKFRPADENPYLQVQTEDPNDLEEFGLDGEDGDFEMTGRSGGWYH